MDPEAKLPSPTIRERELRVLRAARAYTASGGIADAAELHEAVDALIWEDPEDARLFEHVTSEPPPCPICHRTMVQVGGGGDTDGLTYVTFQCPQTCRMPEGCTAIFNRNERKWKLVPKP